MRRSITILLALLLVLTASVLTADEGLWSPVRTIVQGNRNVTVLVETSLALVNTFHPKPGMTFHITTGLGGADFTELAIKLSESGALYAYLLEVWTKRDAVCSKAMEYSYDDASAGQIVFWPYAFDDSYPSGSLHRVEFQHTGSQRKMTLYSQHAVAVNSVTSSIGLAQEQGGYVDLYLTAHLNTSNGGSAANDAYLFGARIAVVTPHRCTAKQGVRDQGDAYNFMYFASPNLVNNGHFDQTGFVEDGQSDDGLYPAASSVDPVNLPTSAEVSAVNVSFQSTTDPDFI